MHLKCRNNRLQLTQESMVYEQMKDRESYLLVGIARSTKFFHRARTWANGSVIPIDMQARSTPCGKVTAAPPPQVSKCSQSANTSLLRADQFVGHAAPTDFSRNQRIHKIYEVQERNENRQQHINPCLPGNLRPSGRECLRHANKADGAPDGREQKRQKSQSQEVKGRPLRKDVAQDEERAEGERQAVEKM